MTLLYVILGSSIILNIGLSITLFVLHKKYKNEAEENRISRILGA